MLYLLVVCFLVCQCTTVCLVPMKIWRELRSPQTVVTDNCVKQYKF